MAKFDFNNSRYAKFFGSKDNVNWLKKLVNTEGVLGCNYEWYKTQGKKASNPVPVANDGTAVFQVMSRPLEAATLMDMRAPLADSLQEDKGGYEFYSASVPDFIGKGTIETAPERDYKVRLFEEWGEDAEFVSNFVDTVQNKVDQVDTTLTFLTARLMSKGFIDYRGIGMGIQTGIHKANIPLENFCKAGVDADSKVWTDPECNILQQMIAIEKQYRDKWGTSANFVWQMPKDMYLNTFLQNKYVKEFIKNYRTLNYIATPEGQITTDFMFQQASADLAGLGLSPIVIVEEKSRNKTANGDTMINGWDKDIAVFRPAGDAMEIQWADVADTRMFTKYGANGITKVFSKTNNGLATLVNTEMNNGSLREWHTDIMMKAMPALIEFVNHVIVDTKRV